MKIRNFGVIAALGFGLAVSGTQAFAQDRDRWHGDDRRDFRHEDRDRDRDYREHERREWAEHHRYFGNGYTGNGYYVAPYVAPYAAPYVEPYYAPAPPPPVYYRPGFSAYFRFGHR